MNRYRLSSLALGTLLIGLSACGGGKGSNNAEQSLVTIDSPAALLSPQDFSVDATSLNAIELDNLIADTDAFFNDRILLNPEETDEDIATITCLDTLSSGHSFQDDGDGYYVFSTPLLDISDCFESANSELGDNYTVQIEVSYYYRIRALDQFGNEIDLSGHGIGDLQNLENEAASAEIYSKSLSASSVVITGSGTTNTVNSDNKFLVSSATDAQQGCLLEFNSFEINDCTSRSLVVGQNIQLEAGEEMDIEDFSYLEIITSNNILSSADGTFYTEGSIEFTLNNWSGVMSYDVENTELPPTYTASNGTEETIGVFGGNRPDLFR